MPKRRSSYEEIPCSAALSYLERELRTWNPLGESIVNGVSLADGAATVVTPRGSRRFKDLTRFKEGGLRLASDGTVKFSDTAEDSVHCLARILTPEVNRTAGSLLLIQHPMAKRGDAWTARSTLRFAHYGDHVYLPVFADDSQSILCETIGCGDHHYFLGALADLDEGDLSRLRQPEFDAESLRRFSRAVQVIVVRAYDGEGWAIWRRKTAVPVHRSLP
jgi:hypothetical protein